MFKNIFSRFYFALSLVTSKKNKFWLFEVMLYILISPIFAVFTARYQTLVILYGSRFGHFLSNTEIFFSDAFNNNLDLSNHGYFVLSDVVDSYELKAMLENAYGIKIFSGFHGRAVFVSNALIRSKIIDTKPISAPQTLPYYSKLNSIIPPSTINDKYVTLSVRNGRYSKSFQNAGSDTTIRDTSLSILEVEIKRLISLGYRIFLVNKNPFDANFLSSLGVENCDYPGLQKSWSLIKGAEFHIDTCTATSLMASSSSTPVVNLNFFYAGSFDTKFWSNGTVSIVLPMLLYNLSLGRVCSVSETIKFLIKMEKDLNSTDLVNREYMFSNGYCWMQNDSSLVSKTIDEMLDYLNTSILNDAYQKKFWEVYPSVWSNIRFPEVVFHDSNFQTSLRVSSSYLTKYLK